MDPISLADLKSLIRYEIQQQKKSFNKLSELSHDGAYTSLSDVTQYAPKLLPVLRGGAGDKKPDRKRAGLTLTPSGYAKRIRTPSDGNGAPSQSNDMEPITTEDTSASKAKGPQKRRLHHPMFRNNLRPKVAAKVDSQRRPSRSFFKFLSGPTETDSGPPNAQTKALSLSDMFRELALRKARLDRREAQLDRREAELASKEVDLLEQKETLQRNTRTRQTISPEERQILDAKLEKQFPGFKDKKAEALRELGEKLGHKADTYVRLVFHDEAEDKHRLSPGRSVVSFLEEIEIEDAKLLNKDKAKWITSWEGKIEKFKEQF